MALALSLARAQMVLAQPVPPYWLPGASAAALLVGFTALLWRWQRRIADGLSHQPARSLLPPGVKPLVTGALALALVVAFDIGFNQARQPNTLPERYNMLDHGEHHAHAASAQPLISVTDLRGPQQGEPDRRFTLIASQARVRLPSGKTIDAWAFNDQIPGPELRIRQGELVECTGRCRIGELA